MKYIRIDEPGAGEWIMRRCGGVFAPERDRTIANYDGSEILGGFVLSGYLGAAISVHTAGDAPGWCSRDLLWMVFHYAFVQLGCRKVIAPVAADNHHALALDMRAGFRLETVITDVYPNGVDLMVLSMTPDHCRWLNIKPTGYQPGHGSTQ
jgi:hypothetical protein